MQNLNPTDCRYSSVHLLGPDVLYGGLRASLIEPHWSVLLFEHTHEEDWRRKEVPGLTSKQACIVCSSSSPPPSKATESNFFLSPCVCERRLRASLRCWEDGPTPGFKWQPLLPSPAGREAEQVRLPPFANGLGCPKPHPCHK